MRRGAPSGVLFWLSERVAALVCVVYGVRMGRTMDATTASKQCAAAWLSAPSSCDVCCHCSVHAMDSVAVCAAAAAASASALRAADSTSTCCGAYWCGRSDTGEEEEEAEAAGDAFAPCASATVTLM